MGFKRALHTLKRWQYTLKGALDLLKRAQYTLKRAVYTCEYATTSRTDGASHQATHTHTHKHACKYMHACTLSHTNARLLFLSHTHTHTRFDEPSALSLTPSYTVYIFSYILDILYLYKYMHIDRFDITYV